MENGNAFARLVQEFGGESQEEEDEAEAEAEVAETTPQQALALDDAKNRSEAVQRKGAGTGKLEGRLIVREKRTTGSVSWRGNCRRLVFRGLTLTTIPSICGLSSSGSSALHGPYSTPMYGRDAGRLGYEQLHADLVAGKVSVCSSISICAARVHLANEFLFSVFNRAMSFYQILYACLGIGQSVFTFGV